MQALRGHHEGSIYRHAGRNVWVAAISLPDGRRRRRQAASRAEALALLRAMQRAVTAEAIDASKIRLGDYLQRWVRDDHGWAPSTARKHESAVRVHLAGGPLGDLRLSEVSVRDVDGWLGGLVGLSPQSRRHLRSTLRRALADAIRGGLVTRNVGALSRSPQLHQRERPTLDATQARRLIDSTRGTRYGPLWTILVTTGLRISEALGLSWSDIDLGGSDARAPMDKNQPMGPAVPVRGGGVRVSGGVAGPSITVRHALQRVEGEWQLRPPKTAKGRRTIPLTTLGRDALRAQRDLQASDAGATLLEALVFTTETGHPIHATNLLPRLRADLAAAGLPRVGLHDLRHSCATILFSLGVPIEVIADSLGHSTVRVTQDLYRHKVPQLQRDAADRLQEALG